MERGIRLIGNGQAPVQKRWQDLLKKTESGDIDPLRMASHRVRHGDLVKVYKKFEARNPKRRMQKVFVQTKFSAPPAPGSPALTT